MTYRLDAVDPRIVARLRRSIFLAAGLLVGSGCLGPRIIDAGDGGDDDGAEDEGESPMDADGDADADDGSSADGTAEGGSAEGTTTVGTADGTSADDGSQLACVGDELSWGQVTMCRPAEGIDCSTCFGDCVPLAQALADEANYGPCGGWEDNVEVVCHDIIDGNCCQLLQLWDIGCAGRPFCIEGQPRSAPVAVRRDWAAPVRPSSSSLDAAVRRRLVEHWAEAARAEHASVAAFARFTLDLLALGAPPTLVTGAQRAMADEVEHARLCFGLASAYGGAPCGPGPLPMTGADHRRDAAQILADAVIEGCIEETLSAAFAAVAAAQARDPAVARALRTIAEDEQRHAALSWSFVRWVLAQHPELRALAEAAFERGLSRARGDELAVSIDDGDDEALAELGVLGVRARRAIAHATVRDAIEPAWRGLLGGTATRVC